MADFESIQNDLTAALKTVLDTLSVDLVGENTRTDGSPQAQSDEWAESRVLDAADLREIGGRTAEHRGQLMVEIYTPLGRGAKRGREIADSIAGAFQGVRVGSVSCYQADYRPGGRDVGSAFWHSGISIRIRWEHAPA